MGKLNFLIKINMSLFEENCAFKMLLKSFSFYRLGYIEKRTLAKMGISTTKYFKRLSLLEVANDFEDEKLNEK